MESTYDNEKSYEVVDLLDIDVDNHDWQNEKNIRIINGKIMDIRTLGKAIQGSKYSFGRNVAKNDGKVFRCKICGHTYSKSAYQTQMSIHLNSKKHMEAVNWYTARKKQHKYVH